jgi:hypothetical protein
MYEWMQDDSVLKKLLEQTREISARQQWLLGREVASSMGSCRFLGKGACSFFAPARKQWKQH